MNQFDSYGDIDEIWFKNKIRQLRLKEKKEDTKKGEVEITPLLKSIGYASNHILGGNNINNEQDLAFKALNCKIEEEKWKK